MFTITYGKYTLFAVNTDFLISVVIPVITGLF